MSVVITREDIIAYAEVDYIIHHMNEKYINKLPETLLKFFRELKDPEHYVYVDPHKPLQTQGLRRYTLEIIALLHLKFWCENEERKKELYDLMLKNQTKLEEQMKEKFSIDKLFDNNSVKVVNEESDLEKEDFSKPRKIQRVVNESKEEVLENDKEEKTEEPQGENLPKEIEEDNQEYNIFSKIKKVILQFFHKKK